MKAVCLEATSVFLFQAGNQFFVFCGFLLFPEFFSSSEVAFGFFFFFLLSRFIEKPTGNQALFFVGGGGNKDKPMSGWSSRIQWSPKGSQGLGPCQLPREPARSARICLGPFPKGLEWTSRVWAQGKKGKGWAKPIFSLGFYRVVPLVTYCTSKWIHWAYLKKVNRLL